MTIYYDEEADIAYFKISDQPVASSKILNDDRWVDLAEDGTPVGLQLFRASEVMPVIKRVHIEKQIAGT
jgi:uncharacterized protein YuzE